MVKRKSMKKKRTGCLVQTILPGAAIVLIGLLIFFCILVYKVSYPGVSIEAVNPSQYILPYQNIEIPIDGKTAIPAWWIPGQQGAPGVILATGYGMSRTDALSLAAALNQMEFNLLVFDQRGSGAEPRGVSTLGMKETTDMINVIRFLKEKPESDPTKIGIWGVDVSAFAALNAAAEFPEVQAIAVDSPFLTIADFLNYRLSEDFGIKNDIVRFICYRVFQLFYMFDDDSKNSSLPVDALAYKSILFIKGGDRPEMADLTSAVFEKAGSRKEMFTAAPARVHTMSGEALEEYDRQIAGFFQLNLK